MGSSSTYHRALSVKRDSVIPVFISINKILYFGKLTKLAECWSSNYKLNQIKSIIGNHWLVPSKSSQLNSLVWKDMHYKNMLVEPSSRRATCGCGTRYLAAQVCTYLQHLMLCWSQLGTCNVKVQTAVKLETPRLLSYTYPAPFPTLPCL